MVTLIFTVLGLSFIASAKTCGPAGNNGPNGVGDPEHYAAKVGDTPVLEETIVKAAMEQAKPKNTNAPANPTLQDLADAYVLSVYNNVDSACLVELADKEGVKLDDNAVVAAIKAQMSEQFQGQSSAQTQKLVDQIAESARQRLKDPVERLTVLSGVANTLVSQQYEKEINVTDEQIRNSYNNYSMKRILLSPATHPKQDVAQLAQSIVADLRANKIKFEDAMDKYTDDAPAAGKPKHENINMADVRTLELTPELKPLVALKPGMISDPLSLKEGAAIYRLDSIQSTLPPDYDKNKAQYRKNYVNGLAVQKLQEGLEKLRSGKIAWKNDGFKFAYEWNRFTNSPGFNSMSLADKKNALQDFIQRGENAATNTDGEGAKAAQGARYLAFNMLSDLSTPEERTALNDQKLKLFSEILNVLDDAAVRIDLAKMYAKKSGEDRKNAATYLEAAAQANQGDFSTAGVRNFGDIAATTDKFLADGVITAENAKAIRDANNIARKQKLEYDFEMERQRKEQEEQQKKEEEERKKAEAEAKKPILRAPGPAAPTGTAPATTAGAPAGGTASKPTTGTTPATPAATPPAGKPAATSTTGK